MSPRARPFRQQYQDALWAENALRPNELLVALAYAKYAGAKDPRTGEKAPDDVAWVEWVTLSTLTGMRAKTTLSRAITGLVEAGWLDQIEPPRQHRAPRYRLTIPADPMSRFIYSHTES